jgi:hypothetical protein
MKIFCNSLIDKNSKELEFMPGVYDNKANNEKLIARNNNGVKFEIPEEKEEERKKTPTGAIIGISVGCLVIIVAIVVFIVKFSKKNKGDGQPTKAKYKHINCHSNANSKD